MGALNCSARLNGVMNCHDEIHDDMCDYAMQKRFVTSLPNACSNVLPLVIAGHLTAQQVGIWMS